MIVQAKEGIRHGARSSVLIVGAGSAAIQLLRALNGTSYRAVGLLDDDESKQKLKLGGVPVLGQIDELPILARRHAVAEVLIAIPSATGAEMLRITEFCALTGLPFRAVPGAFSMHIFT
jgi:FlaA1/EpsC-like NDP-sugar epimerase